MSEDDKKYRFITHIAFWQDIALKMSMAGGANWIVAKKDMPDGEFRLSAMVDAGVGQVAWVNDDTMIIVRPEEGAYSHE